MTAPDITDDRQELRALAKTIAANRKKSRAITRSGAAPQMVDPQPEFARRREVGASIETRTLSAIMADPSTFAPPAYVVEPFAVAGCVTVIAGPPKTAGKSTMMTAATAAVTLGADFLGRPTTQGPVVWLALDEHPRDLARRAQPLDIEGDSVHVFEERPDIVTLDACLRDVRPVLLVIDSLADYAEGVDLSDNAKAGGVIRPIIEMVRQYPDMATVFIHHEGKGGQYLGATRIFASVDGLFSLKPVGRKRTSTEPPTDPTEAPDDDDGTIADDGRRYLGGRTRWAGKMGMRLYFDGSTFHAGNGSRPLVERVAELIAVQPGISGSNVAIELMCQKAAALQAVRALEDAGCIARDGRGYVRTSVPLTIDREDTGNRNGNRAGIGRTAKEPPKNRTEAAPELHRNRYAQSVPDEQPLGLVEREPMQQDHPDVITMVVP
jgi:hypothetical protein